MLNPMRKCPILNRLTTVRGTQRVNGVLHWGCVDCSNALGWYGVVQWHPLVSTKLTTLGHRRELVNQEKN